MFTLNNHINTIKDVPSDWIFENYLSLPEVLTGQKVRIKSIFNDKDNDPSMYIYYDEKVKYYKFKCFSTGRYGNAVECMKAYWKKDYFETCEKIINDYLEYKKLGKPSDKKEFQTVKWTICEHTRRLWTVNDAKYWTQFNIGSSLLERYKVYPIDKYTMCKSVNGILTGEVFTIQKPNIYGFYHSKDTLYKVYQPLYADKKFLKLADYTQGFEQLENKNNLIITSSLKDCMAIKSIKDIDVDVLAPSSENTKLPEEMIDYLKTKYKTVVTYMDSDPAGVLSMQYYFDKYNLPFVYINKEKDFSDLVKSIGIFKATTTFIPVLDKAIMKYYLIN